LGVTAPVLEHDRLHWVVTRHESDYRRSALVGDEIVAWTWVGTASRRAFDRCTELVRGWAEKVLARARTAWCPIDAASDKPTDVSAEVRARFSVPEQPLDP
jgi:acyl-CoA thioester hydrolase